MQKMFAPSRFVLIFAALALFLAVYISALYILQVNQPWNMGGDEVHTALTRRTTTIAAARGNIYDRNSVLLASGRPSYNIMLDWNMIRGNPAANEEILNLIYAAMDADIPYTDTFPVSRGAPFEFVANMTNSQRTRLDAYLEANNLDPDISASDFLARQRNHWQIDYTIGILDARLIMGIRYELEIRAIMGNITPYIFAQDVSTEFIAYIAERGFRTVFAESTFVREYHTVHAPHIIGYVGPMTAEEFEHFRELGYPMNAIVGKMGAERAFEEQLHGREGQMITETSIDGTVLSRRTTVEPEPGSHVYLTLDLGLQIAAENALRTQIGLINAQREAEAALTIGTEDEEEAELIPGGAVVALDVNTGEILAAATYPTFNVSTVNQDWAMLNTDMRNPMLNRATQGIFVPGSTFKMVTGLAALRNINDLGRWTPINCRGRFDKYEHVGDGLVLFCSIYTQAGVGHGNLDMVKALEVSCNYYFLQVADNLASSARERGEILAQTAMEFGLGIRTGLEIPENPGRLATPDFVTGVHGWYVAGDVLTTSFGQNENRFTPVQLANYAATIANGGTLHSLSILRRIRRADFTGEPLFLHEPKVINQIEETEFVEVLREGMIAASRGPGGTGRSVFGPGNYDMIVASKTGTSQVDRRRENDGVFVCFAPANNPEIAIAIVVEKGGSGAQVMDIARMILDHHFATEGIFQATPYGQMIP